MRVIPFTFIMLVLGSLVAACAPEQMLKGSFAKIECDRLYQMVQTDMDITEFEEVCPGYQGYP